MGKDVRTILVADNVSKPKQPDEQPIHLGKLGEEVLGKSDKCLDEIGMLRDLVSSMHCKDDVQLQYSPVFLHRTYEDCKEKGIDLPSTVPQTVVRRSAFSKFKEGHPSAAFASFDVRSDMQYGVGNNSKYHNR